MVWEGKLPKEFAMHADMFVCHLILLIMCFLFNFICNVGRGFLAIGYELFSKSRGSRPNMRQTGLISNIYRYIVLFVNTTIGFSEKNFCFTNLVLHREEYF